MQNNQYPIFKGRPSALGQIMTEARGKSNEQLYQELLTEINEKYEVMRNTVKTKADFQKQRSSLATLLWKLRPMKLDDKKSIALMEKIQLGYNKLSELNNPKVYLKKERKSIATKLLKLRSMEPTRDKPNLSQTCLSYVELWMKEKLYNRKKEFSNKYTEKGLKLEDASIEYISKYFGWEGVEKNTKRESNNWIEGECDIRIGSKFGADVKNSYDFDTFPLFEKDIPTKGYEWQLQGYADLYGFERLRLIYVLMDGTEEMIDKESYFEMKRRGLEEIDEDLWNEVKSKMTYSHLPDDLRIKYWSFDRDNEMINAVHIRVEEIRTYIAKYTNFYELLDNLQKHNEGN